MQINIPIILAPLIFILHPPLGGGGVPGDAEASASGEAIGYGCQDEQRMLVYEYMARGSLEHHLFKSKLPSSSIDRYLLTTTPVWRVFLASTTCYTCWD
jgi:hypothetical protein